MKVKIDYINDLGLGVAHTATDKIFVPYTLTGEEVIISKSDVRGKYLLAALTSIEKPSQARATPPCEYYGKCGGCQLQHMNDKSYENFKTNLLKAALKKLNQNEDVLTKIIFSNYGDRRRTTFRTYKKNNELIFGYSAFKSNSLISVSKCLLLDDKINKLIPLLKEIVLKLDEVILSYHTPLNISITQYYNGSEILFYTNLFPLNNKIKKTLESLANIAIKVVWQFKDITTVIKETTTPKITFNEIEARVPPGTFLQATQKTQDEIIKYILSKIVSNQKVLDLFAGAGTYSIPISKQTIVHAVEGNAKLLTELAKWPNITAVSRDLYNKPLKTSAINEFDIVIINPPRNGATPQILNIAKSILTSAILVYCDLVSFIRDSKIMLANGWQIKEVMGLDQFYQSYHIEIVAYFKK